MPHASSNTEAANTAVMEQRKKLKYSVTFTPIPAYTGDGNRPMLQSKALSDSSNLALVVLGGAPDPLQHVHRWNGFNALPTTGMCCSSRHQGHRTVDRGVSVAARVDQMGPFPFLLRMFRPCHENRLVADAPARLGTNTTAAGRGALLLQPSFPYSCLPSVGMVTPPRSAA